MDNTSVPNASIAPEETVITADTTFNPNQDNKNTQSKAPRKIKGRVIATLFGILLLLGGVGAGLVLINNQQHLGQKAATPTTCNFNSIRYCVGQEIGSSCSNTPSESMVCTPSDSQGTCACVATPNKSTCSTITSNPTCIGKIIGQSCSNSPTDNLTCKDTGAGACSCTGSANPAPSASTEPCSFITNIDLSTCDRPTLPIKTGYFACTDDAGNLSMCTTKPSSAVNGPLIDCLSSSAPSNLDCDINKQNSIYSCTIGGGTVVQQCVCKSGYIWNGSNCVINSTGVNQTSSCGSQGQTCCAPQNNSTGSICNAGLVCTNSTCQAAPAGQCGAANSMCEVYTCGNQCNNGIQCTKNRQLVPCSSASLGGQCGQIDFLGGANGSGGYCGVKSQNCFGSCQGPAGGGGGATPGPGGCGTCSSCGAPNSSYCATNPTTGVCEKVGYCGPGANPYSAIGAAVFCQDKGGQYYPMPGVTVRAQAIDNQGKYTNNIVDQVTDSKGYTLFGSLTSAVGCGGNQTLAVGIQNLPNGTLSTGQSYYNLQGVSAWGTQAGVGGNCSVSGDTNYWTTVGDVPSITPTNGFAFGTCPNPLPGNPPIGSVRGYNGQICSWQQGKTLALIRFYGCGGAPTPVPAAPQCTAAKAYDSNWNLLTPTQLSSLTAGTNVYFTVVGATPSTFDKARFTINGTLLPETTATKPGGAQEFYVQYTIPTSVTSFTITAQLHDSGSNQWY